MIQKIKDSIGLVSYVGRYVTLKKNGNKYWGLCPFHGEKTPSFTVTDRGYYCFGCKEHGDLIDFAVAYHGKDKREAIRELANEVGVSFKPLPPKKTLTYIDGKLDPTGIGERELSGLKDVELWPGTDLMTLARVSGYLSRRGATVTIEGGSPIRWIVSKLGSVRAVKKFVSPMRMETDKEIYIVEAENQFGFKNTIRIMNMERLKNIDFKREALEYLEAKCRD